MENKQNNKTSKLNIIKIMNSAICDMEELPKKMLKYATPVIMILLAIGAALFVKNKTSLDYDSFFNFTTTTLITNTVFVMAEFIIASLAMDIIIKRKSE